MRRRNRWRPQIIGGHRRYSRALCLLLNIFDPRVPQYQRSRHQRKKVEMLFAHLKRILKLDRLRLRGLSGAGDEFTLAAAVQNLRRLAKLIPHGPPVPA
jgi:hypothetical protein